MIDQYIILLLAVFIVFSFIFFLLGYLIGRTSSQTNIGGQSNSFKTISAKNNKKLNEIYIDEKTVVTEIKTDGLEKKYSNIANTVESNQSVTNSIDKLKKLKK